MIDVDDRLRNASRDDLMVLVSWIAPILNASRALSQALPDDLGMKQLKTRAHAYRVAALFDALEDSIDACGLDVSKDIWRDCQ